MAFRLVETRRQEELAELNTRARTRTRINTNPKGTEANAAGRSVRESYVK
jgi:hypothetical protein